MLLKWDRCVGTKVGKVRSFFVCCLFVSVILRWVYRALNLIKKLLTSACDYDYDDDYDDLVDNDE